VRDDVRGQAFNFAPQQPVTVRAMVDAIAAAVGVPADPVVLATATHEIREQVLDASKAQRVLGWSAACPLDEGLRATVAWYRDFLGAHDGSSPQAGAGAQSGPDAERP
jgi:CDP-glucose 4,6-dehydratase